MKILISILSLFLIINLFFVSKSWAACGGDSECCGSVKSCTNCQTWDDCTNGQDCDSGSDCPGGSCTSFPWCTWVGCNGTTCAANSCPASTTRAANSCCDNNCTNRSNYCTGSGYYNGCGNWCSGTKAQNCSNAGNVCQGSSYPDPNGCGTCNGTKTQNCSNNPNVCAGSTYPDPNGCGTCTGTKPQNCSGAGSVCIGVPYADPNGCGNCTGTLAANCSVNQASVCSGVTYTSQNTCGACSGTMCNAPGAPTLTSPAEGELVNYPVNLQWSAPAEWNPSCTSANYVGTYEVCIADSLANIGAGNCNRTPTGVWLTGLTGNSYSFTPTYPGTHYWAVRARSTCGATGAASSIRSVNVGATLAGYLFDSTEMSSCPADPSTVDSSLKIVGALITEAPNGRTAWTVPANPPYYSAGYYAMGGLNIGVNHSLTFSIPGFSATTPDLNCTTNFATVSYTATERDKVASFGFIRIYGGWWRAVGGIAYGGAGIASNIPRTMAADQRYMFLADANGNTGFPMINTGTVDVGTSPGVAINSGNMYTTGTRYRGDRQDYAYFVNKLTNYTKTAVTAGNLASASFGAYNEGTNDFQILTVNGDVNNFQISPLASQKIIVLVNGSVTVTGNIDVPTTAGANNGSFLAVIASGTITFAANVTQAEGWYLGNAIAIAADATNQFRGEGSFVGLNSLTMARDRGITNNTAPAEDFYPRADLMINAPAPMKLSLGEVKIE